jgi:hypothetical protein
VRLAGVTVNGGTADLTIPAGYVATVGTLALTWVDTP